MSDLTPDNGSKEIECGQSAKTEDEGNQCPLHEKQKNMKTALALDNHKMLSTTELRHKSM